MFLKKLELVGFKSFFNKTKLRFEPGVTAIVGPNGCGKSNIVDSIKWVLGEQSSKSIRGSSMQDVIFNGTEKFDPVSFAEVSLTFSNESRSLPVDYDEVTISRRLFRSGESEYLLNKTAVRLADIRNILMGTGIGTSSYSIIEQGKMDRILSSRPEERRHVFEEASGITKFKAQKREAMLKLERTHDNLTRLNDIIREVERQIKSIERQARKAERYKMRYSEMKDLDVKLSHKKYKELNLNDSDLGAENEKLRSLSGELSAQVEESITDLTRRRQEFTGILEELQASQSEVMRLSSDIDKNNHIIKVNNERIQELKKQLENLDQEIERATERKESLRVRFEDLETRFSGVSGRCQGKQDELTAVEVEVKELSDKVEACKQQLKSDREKTVDVVAEQTKLKNMMIKINANIQNRLSRERRIKIERENVDREKSSASEDLKLAEAKLQEIEADLQQKKKEVHAFNDEYLSRQQRLSVLNNERTSKEKRLHEIKPRREFLEKLIAEREGIGDSVKEVMSRVEAGEPRFVGVHGILSEIIGVNEEYEESMGFIIGDLAQSIVVDTRGVADRVGEYLKESSMESVNFIILEELLKQNGNCVSGTQGTLDDVTHVLSAKEPYRSALRNLLSDVFVTVSSEAARMLIDENENFKGRIIEEKGEIHQRGMHRSRNYSEKEVLTLFGRKEKVEQMREEEARISKEIDDMTVGIEELEYWLRESAIIKDRLESELQTRRMKFADISSRKNSIKEKVDSLVEELVLLETELEEEIAAIKEFREEGEGINGNLQELENEHGRLQMAIEDSQKFIQTGARDREAALYKISDIKAELSALRKEEENLSENLEREKEFFQRVDMEVGDRHRRMRESEERIRALEEEMKALEERNLENGAVQEVKNRENSEKRTKKEELDEMIRQAEASVREKEQQLEEVRNKTRDTDINKKEYEYKKEAIVTKMMDAYRVDITRLEEAMQDTADWDEVERNIEELRAQLEKMGEVSLGAVEEHKDLEERFQFLTKQRDDLVKGKEDLMQAIARINRTTRKLFMETFENVGREFNSYFRMLFNGGKAELVLEDESNVLECGVDIEVRPPGKKLHNIMQLSGGEKAMTAIALIFALFKVNPSPFCILDEVDAPLDESNIVRFSRVLQEFLKTSQFLVVTHNRMTIQLADILYGITMEDKGVSKVVSVKFSEDKKVAEDETVPAAV